MDYLDLFNLLFNKLVDIEKLLIQKDKPFMDIDAASEYLRLSQRTLYSYTREKVLPHYKLRSRRVYFKKDDLDDFVLDKNSRMDKSSGN